jgi:hypothetical protein
VASQKGERIKRGTLDISEVIEKLYGLFYMMIPWFHKMVKTHKFYVLGNDTHAHREKEGGTQREREREREREHSMCTKIANIKFDKCHMNYKKWKFHAMPEQV